VRKWLLTLLVLAGVLVPTAVAFAKVLPMCGPGTGGGGFC
jgi:hypothetical protein